MKSPFVGVVMPKVLANLSCSAWRLDEPEQHSKKGEEANEDEENGDGDDRRMHSLLFQAGDWRERLTPHVANRPNVLPKRDQQCHDTASNQRQAQILRRMRKIGFAGAGRLFQVIKVLDDREPKTNQR